MVLAQLVKEPELNESQSRLRAQFFDATGYGSNDLLSLSYATRHFLTRDGGKYYVREDGGIDHLAGPTPDLDDRL